MIARALAWLLLKTAGKEEREMLVRLYADEILVHAGLQLRGDVVLGDAAHDDLACMGYFDDVEE